MKNHFAKLLIGSLFLLITHLNLLAQQIDSFSVAGRMFRFNIPKDWILEKNSDNIVSENEWNVVIRHAVNTKCSYAYICIGFFRPKSKTEQTEYEPYYKALIDSIDIVDYSTNYRYKSSKINCRNRVYNTYNFLPMNDSLNIVTTLLSAATDTEQINLGKIYADFETHFKHENKKELCHLMPANYFYGNGNSENIILNDSLKFSVPQNWSSKIETSNGISTIRLNPISSKMGTIISFTIFDSVSEYHGIDKLEVPMIQSPNYQFSYEKLGSFRVYRTLRVLNISSNNPNNYDIEVSYTMDYNDEKGNPKHVVTTVKLTTRNSLTVFLYANTLRGLLSQLIYNNNFSPN